MSSHITMLQHLVKCANGAKTFTEQLITPIVETIASAMVEIEGLKANKPQAIFLIISKEEWQETSEDAPYPYECSIAIPDLTALDIVTVTISPQSQEIALACGLCSTNQSDDGTVRLWVEQIPVAEMIGEYYITQGKEQ